MQKSGEQVRVNVQLINALNDAHLWAETYDRKLTDIFAVESDIAKTVAENLQAKLNGRAEKMLAARPTENPEAHQLYLKGRFFWNKRTPENLRKAIDYFQQAIEKDPAFALAYAGLADAHAILPIYASTSPNEDVPAALAAARKAVELDDSLAEGTLPWRTPSCLTCNLPRPKPSFAGPSSLTLTMRPPINGMENVSRAKVALPKPSPSFDAPRISILFRSSSMLLTGAF